MGTQHTFGTAASQFTFGISTTCNDCPRSITQTLASASAGLHLQKRLMPHDLRNESVSVQSSKTRAQHIVVTILIPTHLTSESHRLAAHKYSCQQLELFNKVFTHHILTLFKSFPYRCPGSLFLLLRKLWDLNGIWPCFTACSHAATTGFLSFRYRDDMRFIFRRNSRFLFHAGIRNCIYVYAYSRLLTMARLDKGEGSGKY